MRWIIPLAVVATTAALGLWSGSTAARHIEDSGIAERLSSHEAVPLEIPSFTVSVSTAGDAIEHVRASISVKLAPGSLDLPGAEDRFSDAVLSAVVSTFEDGKNHASADEGVARKIVKAALSKLGEDGGIEELQIKKLAVFTYKRAKY